MPSAIALLPHTCTCREEKAEEAKHKGEKWTDQAKSRANRFGDDVEDSAEDAKRKGDALGPSVQCLRQTHALSCNTGVLLSRQELD